MKFSKKKNKVLEQQIEMIYTKKISFVSVLSKVKSLLKIFSCSIVGRLWE